MEQLKKHILNSPAREAWRRIGIYPHHGINLPLFSIRSTRSSGIGEFLDLIPIIDWCEEIGFDVIQLLPLNDTGYETSPYNALSSLALNPIYLSLTSLPYVASDEELGLDLEGFAKYQTLQRVAYEAVLNAKLSFMRRYFAKYFAVISKSPEYEEFIQKQEWVFPYALFKVLKDNQVHKNWAKWPPKLRDPTKKYFKQLEKKHRTEMDFYIFLQFLCFVEMKQVHLHARKKGVWIKGDIPILISPESSDVWLFRQDFNRDFSAGAPPDMFNPEGQNWGFPIYRWDSIESDNFSWWRRRLEVASTIYDIYRVDHIIGFYRIWAMRRGESAIEGSYYPSDEWARMIQGEKILSHLMRFSSMLPIGEDLGIKIEKIRASLHQLGIPGTKIPRWERYHETDNSFVAYEKFNPLSLTSVSTHDSETLEQWWTNNPKDATLFCKTHGMKYTPIFNNELRYQMLLDSHKTPSLFHINLLSEYMALYPELVWKNPDDERVNLPGTILPSNWCYRFRPFLEEILSHKNLKEAMKSLTTDSRLVDA